MLEIQENRPKIAKIQEIQDRWDLCLCILPNYADSNFYKSVYPKKFIERQSTLYKFDGRQISLNLVGI